MLKISKKGKSGYGIRGLLLSALIGLLCVVVFAFVFSFIALSSENPILKTDIYALFALVLSGVFSSFVNSKRTSFQRAMLSSLLIALILLLFGIIFSSGKIGVGALMNYGCFILTSLVGAYLGRKKEKKHKRHKRASHA